MKTIKAVENFLSVLDENNFVDLFIIKELETEKQRGICSYKKEEAERQLEYMKRTEPNKKFYMTTTTVFFG